MTGPSRTDLEQLITGRRSSFFRPDIERRAPELSSAVEGRRVLVVGGGGSIGGATARALLELRPAAMHVVDISENYLAELVRDVRSGNDDFSRIDFQTHVLDYGAPLMRRFLAAENRFDIVLNFAAVKHVRSEKDVFSLLHMFDVNIVRQARFKSWLVEFGHCGRYFTVSTDKAANPTSLMGASKRVMEDVAFDTAGGTFNGVTCARFANVAFSNGSLLQGFLARLEKRQPLAAPIDTRRYFITHAEAADICLLSALVAPAGNVLIPALNPEAHLLLLQDVAARVLAAHGYAAWFTDDEVAAKAAMGDVATQRSWPVLLTPLDTDGEKPFEEFLGDGERAVRIGLETLLAIRHVTNTRVDDKLLAELARYIDHSGVNVDKEHLAALLNAVVPTMRHVETGRHLDTRM